MKAGRIIKLFFTIFTTLVLTVSLTVFVLTYFYSDEIKQYGIKELNLYLNTAVNVKEIDFSFFRKFPDATIIFKDVVVKSSQTYAIKDFKQNTDTLLKAKTILLQFDLLQVLQKKYNLKAIQVNNASALLCIDKKGKNNFSIFKEDVQSSSDSINIKLEKLKFINTDVLFLNASNRLEINVFTKDFKLSGDFYKDEFKLSSHGELNLKKFIIQKVNYLKTNKTAIKVEIDVHNNEYSIKRGIISFGNINLNLSGTYQINEKTDAINFKIRGKQIPLDDLISSLPDKYQVYFKNIDSNGNIDFNANINGGLSYKETPRIKVFFSLNNAQLKNTKANLSNLYIKGSFDNGIKQSLISSSFNIDTFYTIINDSILYGHFSMYNFASPLIKLQLKGGLDLAQWKSLLNLDTFSVLQGQISLKLNYTGKINNLSQITASDLRNAIIIGNVNVNNASFQLKRNPYLIKNFTGNLIFRNNNVQIENGFLVINNTQFLIKGLVKNFIAYLMLENEKLDASVEVNLNKFNISDWKSDEDSSGVITFPENIHIISNFSIDEFLYDKFIAKQIHGLFEINKSNLYYRNLNFNTLEGSISMDGNLSINTLKELTLQSKVKTNNINIKKLFQSMDNFGQTFITDKHIQGKLIANIPFVQVRWDSSMNVIDKDIILDATVQIKNGQLNEFEPLYDLADYVELNELKKIAVSDIENNIYIKDRKIIIPNMHIKANDFNIELSGEHTFDNKINYRIKILLREWLASKARKNKKENQEFGIEENDGLGSTSLYLTLKGTTDNYKISYFEPKLIKEQIKESLKKEKLELKTILYDEFGLFKKDSDIIKQYKQQEDVKKTKFKISWEEDENTEIDKTE